jgi:hypothetical protein
MVGFPQVLSVFIVVSFGLDRLVFDLLFQASVIDARHGIRSNSFLGVIFPNLPFRLEPILSRVTIGTALLLI